jgi:Protein of unknown function (DUF732)
MTNFVNPPLTDVEDYPTTGSYPLSPEEFSGLDTRLAWSAVEPKPYFNEPPKHGWAGTIKVAAAAAAAVLGAIVAAAVMLNPPGHVESASVTQTVTATTAASPTREADPGPPPGPFVMPTVMAAHEAQDGDFLQRLAQAGWDVSNRAGMIQWGHDVCTTMARYSWTPEMLALQQSEYKGWPQPTLTASYLKGIHAAAQVYCPKLDR